MKDLFTLIAFFSMCFEGDNPFTLPIVQTDTGMISGQYITVGNKDVTRFLGIPYAEPPGGKLRFKKPVPIKKWDYVLPATTKPLACMQYSSRNIPWYATTVSSEDCLGLNIWIPGKCLDGVNRCPRKPVFIWIYGGGFAGGSTDMPVYDGAVLSSLGDIIVVTINYRVGIFGFVNIGTEMAPGNMGLYDQNLAMKWIYKNIKYFGGNPKEITLAGAGSGAMSVGLHIISPMSKGLFHRAIMQSSSPYHPVLTEDPVFAKFKANVVAELLGCSHMGVTLFKQPLKVLHCLKNKSAVEVAVSEDLVTQKVPFLFLPRSGDQFIPMHPIKAMETEQFEKVELLIGNMKDEGTIFLNYMMPRIFSLDWEPKVTPKLATAIFPAILGNLTNPSPALIEQFYLENISSSSPDLVNAVAGAYADYVFNCPSLFFAEKFKKVYFYQMDPKAKDTKDAKWTGATHFSDVPYVFGIPVHDQTSYTKKERDFSLDLIDKWTSFAKTGSPQGKGHWPRFFRSSAKVRILGVNKKSVRQHDRLEFCKFWRPHFVPPKEHDPNSILLQL